MIRATTKVVTTAAAIVHDQRLEERLGTEIVDELRAADVLIPAGEAEFFPCDGGGAACPRTVYRNLFRGSPEPHFAWCRASECSNLRLTTDQIRTSEVRGERFVVLLQDLLGIPRTLPREDAVVERAWLVGSRTVGRETRPVVALIQPQSLKLAISLAELQERYRRPLVVLLTTDTVVPVVLREYLPGSELELVLLEHRLRFEHGAFRWVDPGALGRVAVVPDDAFAMAFDGESRRIDESECREMLADAEQRFDLLIDRTRGEHRPCRVWSRGENGKLRGVELTGEEGVALDRLVRKREPMCAAELRDCLGQHHRWVAKLRKKIDRQLEGHRYKWHLIQTTGGREKSQEFMFDPVGTCRLMLLSPVDV